MDGDMIDKAETYASRRDRHVTGRLGFGIHGTVFALEGNVHPGAAALKVHEAQEPYVREREVYIRLAEHRIDQICGFDVPAMIDYDDDLWALEMTIVKPPFVLDFAGRGWIGGRSFPMRFGLRGQRSGQASSETIGP